MTMLCEEQSALVLRDAVTKHHHSFEAQSPIQLPDAGRALPPISSSSSTSPTDHPSSGGGAVVATIPARIKGWTLALVLGRALPPAPANGAALTPPVAWHCHQPRLATVDGQSRVLIYSDPAGPGVSGATGAGAGASAGAGTGASASGVGSGVTPGGGGAGEGPGVMKPPAVLRHSLHASARALAWRPKAGATLAVGGSHGVCVWSHEPEHGAGFNGGGGGGGGGDGNGSGRGGGGSGVKVVGGGRGRIGGAVRVESSLQARSLKGAWFQPSSLKSEKPVSSRCFQLHHVPLRIGGAPEWKLQHLRDVDDCGWVFGDDPFKSAGVSAVSRVVNALRRLVPKGLTSAVAADRTPAAASSAPVDSLVWSPCGRLLAAGSANRRAVTLWDLSTAGLYKLNSVYP
jgi:aladin